MTTYWIKPKRYGYGATPVTWQGYVLSFVSILVVVAATMLILEFERDSLRAALAIIAFDGFVVLAVWPISRRKTEGEWRWRWGRDANGMNRNG